MKQSNMKYSGYWLSIEETNLDNHVLHTFLSCNPSFPSLSRVTSFITPTNDGPVSVDGFYSVWPTGTISKLRLTSDVPKLSPPVNIIVYDSIFQRCDRHRQLPGYLSFNSLTLEPSCRPCRH